jgi:hypothetical protein
VVIFVIHSFVGTEVETEEENAADGEDSRGAGIILPYR